MSIKEYLNLIIGACEENNAEVISRIKAYAQRALKSVYIQDQILLNMDTLPEDEARFQAGYSRGREVGYERGKGEQPGLPPLPEPILTDKDVRDWEGEKSQQYVKALEVNDFGHQLYPGDSIKLYGKETIITGFSAQYNDALEKWETIIHTTGRGDPFERTLPDIEVLEDQPRSYEKRTAQLLYPQQGPLWVKASIPNIKDGEYISKYRKSPNDAWHIGVSVVDATHIHFIEKVSYNIRWQKGHEELHNLFILDESGTAAAVTPTFWDVAKAFKWAAEYRDEIGGQLTLYNDQWTLISEDEDGNENETKDLTPGSVAELYCLQNGFNKENEGTVAAREEDAVAFAEWAGWDWRRVEGKSLWENQKTLEVMKTAQLYKLFKQQKEK